MRHIKVLSVVIAVLGGLACGGGGPLGGPEDALARIGEEYLTEDDFRAVFTGLSPEDQVAVLDPGGRMDLVDRLIDKRLLEKATDSTDLPGLEWWLSLYSRTELASAYTASLVDQAREQVTDSGDGGSDWFVMDIALIDDSADARELARLWEAQGPTAPEGGLMALAPWSNEEGSYRRLENYVELMPVYLEQAVMEHAGQGVAVAPMFGEYAVFRITTSRAETPMRAEDAIPAVLTDIVYAGADVRPRSEAIARFAASVSLESGGWRLEDGDWNPGDTLVAYSGGAVTAGEAALLIRRLNRQNFLSEPTELARVMPPRPSEAVDHVTVWMYLTGIARTYWQADMALEQGIEADQSALRMAEVEHLLRTRVIGPLASEDSSTMRRFYNDNIRRYTIPQRRAVLRVDIPAADTAGMAVLSTLQDLQARGDSAIRLSISPLLTEGAFGPIGPEVFAADTAGVQGPVVLADTLPLVYFQVVAMEPESLLGFDDVAERIRSDYIASNAADRLDQLLVELREEYDVEIDSTAVRRVDPW